MRLENTVVISGPARPIFDLAAGTERWPEILPHYRRVSILEATHAGRRVEMAAWRGRIPVKWQAVQTTDPVLLRIRFEHVKGFTRGMEVEWCFEPEAPTEADREATRVTIAHHLETAGLGLRGRLIDKVVAPMFIDFIATQTLARMKELAESLPATAAEAGKSGGPQSQPVTDQAT